MEAGTVIGAKLLGGLAVAVGLAGSVRHVLSGGLLTWAAATVWPAAAVAT